MSLGSVAFALVLLPTLLLYYALPAARRWLSLLAGTIACCLVFDLVHLPVLLLLTLGAYLAAVALEHIDGRRSRRLVLLAILVFLAAVLIGFRAAAFVRPGSFAVPLGLSFVTLRLAGYVVDVFRRAIPAERHAGKFSAFASFFPELASGPIERGSGLLPQLGAPPGLQYEAIASGSKLFAWGLFKKIVVADRLALFVNAVYGNVGGYDGAAYAVATVLFAVQLYCDFSGYTDMAIGVGRMFGLRLARNFDRPYEAKTIAEFWTRWHISFSTWLRDYIFLPLVYRSDRLLDGRLPNGIDPTKAAYALASMTTMALCGLWHGASWNYLLWGQALGAFMVGSVLTRKWRARVGRRVWAGKLRALRDPARTAMTFCLVCVSWVFFRANSVGDALQMLVAIPAGVASYAGLLAWAVATGAVGSADLTRPLLLGQTRFDLFVALAAVSLLILVERLQARGNVRLLVFSRPAWVRWPLYAAFVFVMLVLRATGGGGFIYAGF